MEKKQLLQNNNGFVGFYPNTFVPFYQLQVNIGSNKSTENFTVEQTVTIDDNFIDTFNKTEEGEAIYIRVDIISDTIVSGEYTPIFEGYKGSSGLYFTHTPIGNLGKENERIYIRNFNINNIDIEAKTADVQFVQRILVKNEFTGDGTKFLSDNGTYKNVPQPNLSNYLAKDNTTEFTPTEDYNPATKKYVDDRVPKPFLNISSLLSKVRTAGIKTQVDVTNEMVGLFGSIASFKNNYANRVYLNNSSPVTLNTNLDAKNEFMFVSVYGGNGVEDTGEQNVENNAFKLYYYNFKINDDNTAVTGYYNTTDIIKDPDRPNQYLSADGTYKYPYAAGIYFGEDNKQVINDKYWGNYVIEKEDNNGNCVLALISDCTELYDEVTIRDLNINRVFGIGGYGILTRIYNNAYPYSKPILIQAVIGHDAQGENYRLHTSDWMVTPCIVKYQNKYYVAIRFGNINEKSITSGSRLNIIGPAANLLNSFIYLNCEEGQLYPTGVEVIREGTYFDKDNIKNDRNNLLAKTNEDGYMSKEDKTKLDNTPTQKILTESEYAALGTTPNTDNVLYFITPD